MTSKWLLVALLRVAGGTMLCALVFVFCPFEWMISIHARLELGEFAHTPVLSYLIRTLSAMYAIVGGLLMFISFDVNRYGSLIRFAGVISILAGVGVTVLDAILQLPVIWTATEGPMTVGMGVGFIVLAKQARV